MRLWGVAVLFLPVVFAGSLKAGTAETMPLCYGCCNQYTEVWFTCCADPYFEQHKVPSFAWGAGVVGPSHDYCSPGPCHASCQTSQTDQNRIDSILAGDRYALAAVLESDDRRFVLAPDRAALLIYSDCGGGRQIAGLVPLPTGVRSVAE